MNASRRNASQECEDVAMEPEVLVEEKSERSLSWRYSRRITKLGSKAKRPVYKSPGDEGRVFSSSRGEAGTVMGMTLKPRDASLPAVLRDPPLGMNRSYPLTASAMVPGFFSYALLLPPENP